MTDAPAVADHAPTGTVSGRSLTRLAFERLVRNRASVASAIVLAIIAAICVFGPYVVPHAYDEVFPAYARRRASRPIRAPIPSRAPCPTRPPTPTSRSAPSP